jgi:hypothetical protein
MPIKTYTKYSKKEKGHFTYLRWQGYQDGQWVQKQIGRAGVKANKIKALKLEIDYLNELIDNLLSELVVRKQTVEALQTQLQELEDKGQGDNEE